MDNHSLQNGNQVRVAMVLSNIQASVGGTQKQALCLASGLQSIGVSVSILGKRQEIFKDTRGGFLGNQPPLGFNGGVKIVRLPTLHSQPAWSFLFSFLIWAGINHRKFQIIHAHNVPLGVISSLVAWLMRKKVVIKIPGMKYVDYLSGDSTWRRFRRWIVTSRTARFIAVNAEMARALQTLGIMPEKIALIPNGIELKDIGIADRDALKVEILGSADPQVVLYVGRLVEVKGLDRLLEVWAAMPNREKQVLVFVGDGPLRKELESKAAKLGVSGSVRFLGHQVDVSKYYAIADIFVLPSKNEGMSNSLLEAMAAGVPVVASDVGGNREVIEDRQSGFLMNWGDTTACVEVLSRLLSDADFHSQASDAAKRRILTFGMGEVAQRYHHLYEAVLQE